MAGDPTNSRNRKTIAASLRLGLGGRFCLNKFCATLMASTITRSGLMGGTTYSKRERSTTAGSEIIRPAYDPRCYWLLPHKLLPSREALALQVDLRPLRQVSVTWSPCSVEEFTRTWCIAT